MRINQENKSMDMEARDINYILPAYVRSYLFYSKNVMPEKIIFPMFPSVMVGDKNIPIEYVPPLDSVAVEISEDGKSVAEVTPAQEAVLDEKDEEIKRLKDEIGDLHSSIIQQKGVELTEKQVDEIVAPGKDLISPAPEDLIRQQEEAAMPEHPEPVSPARAAYQIDPDPTHQPPSDRIPNQPPGGDIGPGSGLSDMHGRDRKDQIRTARDLVEDAEIDESAEKPFEKEIKRDEQGRPIVEGSEDG